MSTRTPRRRSSSADQTRVRLSSAQNPRDPNPMKLRRSRGRAVSMSESNSPVENWKEDDDGYSTPGSNGPTRSFYSEANRKSTQFKAGDHVGGRIRRSTRRRTPSRIRREQSQEILSGDDDGESVDSSGSPVQELSVSFQRHARNRRLTPVSEDAGTDQGEPAFDNHVIVRRINGDTNQVFIHYVGWPDTYDEWKRAPPSRIQYLLDNIHGHSGPIHIDDVLTEGGAIRSRAISPHDESTSEDEAHQSYDSYLTPETVGLVRRSMMGRYGTSPSSDESTDRSEDNGLLALVGALDLAVQTASGERSRKRSSRNRDMEMDTTGGKKRRMLFNTKKDVYGEQLDSAKFKLVPVGFCKLLEMIVGSVQQSTRVAQPLLPFQSVAGLPPRSRWLPQYGASYKAPVASLSSYMPQPRRSSRHDRPRARSFDEMTSSYGHSGAASLAAAAAALSARSQAEDRSAHAMAALAAGL